jgi:hypothetical protein
MEWILFPNFSRLPAVGQVLLEQLFFFRSQYRGGIICFWQVENSSFLVVLLGHFLNIYFMLKSSFLVYNHGRKVNEFKVIPDWRFRMSPLLIEIETRPEPEFLNILWRLKSWLFEGSCLFKGQSVQQGLHCYNFLCVDCTDYFVKNQ